MIGTPETSTWVLVAEDIDGQPQDKNVGRRTETLYARFAYRDQALSWILEHEDDGWELDYLAACACSYYGPTDAPSNCWAAEVSRVLS